MSQADIYTQPIAKRGSTYLYIKPGANVNSIETMGIVKDTTGRAIMDKPMHAQAILKWGYWDDDVSEIQSKEALAELLKGGPSSGWYAPPKGTHTGEKHRSVGSGKATPSAAGKIRKKKQPEPMPEPEGIIGSSPVKESKSLKRGEKGINDSAVLEFADGSKGLFKDARMKHGTIEGEVLAYEFSESIGWDLVPETTVYESAGKRGSLQRWVNDTTTGYDPPKGISSRAQSQDDRMYVMDALFDNTDRNQGNYIYSNDGSNLWAIDNGGFFGIGAGGLEAAKPYTPRIRRAWSTRIANPAVWEEVLNWSKSDKAKEFISKVENTMGPTYSASLQSFLQSDLPDSL